MSDKQKNKKKNRPTVTKSKIGKELLKVTREDGSTAYAIWIEIDDIFYLCTATNDFDSISNIQTITNK